MKYLYFLLILLVANAANIDYRCDGEIYAHVRFAVPGNLTISNCYSEIFSCYNTSCIFRGDSHRSIINVNGFAEYIWIECPDSLIFPCVIEEDYKCDDPCPTIPVVGIVLAISTAIITFILIIMMVMTVYKACLP